MTKKLTKWCKPLTAIIVAFALALVALLPSAFGMAKPPQASAEDDTVAVESADKTSVTFNLYYYGNGGDYEGMKFSAWIWPQGGAGTSYGLDSTAQFECGDGVTRTFAKASVQFDLDLTNTNAVGFIMFGADKYLTGSTWPGDEYKLYSGDRFALSADVVNGVANIFCKNDEEEAVKDVNDLDFSSRIKSARFTVNDSGAVSSVIPFVTSVALPESAEFVLKDNTGVTYAGTTRGSGTTGSYTVTDASALTAKNLVERTFKLVDTVTGDDAFKECTVTPFGFYGSKAFNDEFEYTGNDLGVTVSETAVNLKLWAPSAKTVTLKIYDDSTITTVAQSVLMTKGEKGVWSTTFNKASNNVLGKYYVYDLELVDGTVSTNVVDPYARSTGANGVRGMILDLSTTDPDGWDEDTSPTLDNASKAVIYEAHVRDLTIHESSGVTAKNRGKFMGLTETGTKVNGAADGKSTGLDYIKSLGVTEVHLLPSFDFATVDETKPNAFDDKQAFNWGYDPQNYNVPEGSYSTDPTKGEVRVSEFKQMVQALHSAGIRVVMDVVYNHVSSMTESNFQKIMPNYFFRVTESGSPYNGSGCGNETASDHSMFGKFMIDSVKYWTEEYHIDGFRFDLMALHDIDTMNKLAEEVRAINPDALIYGEGWTGGTSGLDASKQCLKDNAKQFPGIAVFNDNIRNAIKGASFGAEKDATGDFAGAKLYETLGFVNGGGGAEQIVSAAKGATTQFAANPTQNINYASAHDNHTLWDKLHAAYATATTGIPTEEEFLKMNKMAAAIYLTSQGPSFMQAGEEMLRSKVVDTIANGNALDNRPTVCRNPDGTYYLAADNSYKSTDSINAIDWTVLNDEATDDMISYYKGVIAFVKANPQFTLATKAEIDAQVSAVTTRNSKVAAYKIKNGTEITYVFFNSNKEAVDVDFVGGTYKAYVKDGVAGTTPIGDDITGNKVSVAAYSTLIMKGTESESATATYEAKATVDGAAVADTVKVGSVVTVSFDMDRYLPSTAFTVTSDNKNVMFERMEDGSIKFTADKAGEYVVKMSGKDLAGNEITAMYTVKVASQGLSLTAKIALGVCIPLLVIATAGIALLFILKKKRQEPKPATASATADTASSDTAASDSTADTASSDTAVDTSDVASDTAVEDATDNKEDDKE